MTAGGASGENVLDVLFRGARTHRKWLPEPVENERLVALYELMKWGPTSFNSFPVRIAFIVTAAAKQRLAPHLTESNRPKAAAAPVVAIVAYDTRFYDWLPRLFPGRELRSGFVDKPQLAETSALRNSSLQGGYLILAARALGLDCGPMSGFDNEAVDREFFPDGQVKSNFLCAIGHGDRSALHERLPRPAFGEVCSIV